MPPDTLAAARTWCMRLLRAHAPLPAVHMLNEHEPNNAWLIGPRALLDPGKWLAPTPCSGESEVVEEASCVDQYPMYARHTHSHTSHKSQTYNGINIEGTNDLPCESDTRAYGEETRQDTTSTTVTSSVQYHLFNTNAGQTT